VPQAETTAANLARLFRVHRVEHDDSARSRVWAARRLLEELGVRCDDSADLQDLKGFLLSSHRGTEIVVRRDLSDEERLAVYAHLVAHALLGPDLPAFAPAAQFEYVDGRAPDRPSRESQEELVADAVAQAILDGRLEATPRLVYCQDTGAGRGRLSRAVLRGLHHGSMALYRRSRRYQWLRSSRVVTALTERVTTLLGSPA
jgi:hypothetical protein